MTAPTRWMHSTLSKASTRGRGRWAWPLGVGCTDVRVIRGIGGMRKGVIWGGSISEARGVYLSPLLITVGVGFGAYRWGLPH